MIDNKFSVVTTILNGVSRRERGLEIDFVDGKFDISETGKENAAQIGVFLGNVFDILGKEVKNSFFMFALLHALSHTKFNKEHFVGKLKKRSKMFSGCVNTLQWYDVIKKVYNTRNNKYKVVFKRKKNRISFIDGIFTIDISEVTTGNVISYEIEIEILDLCNVLNTMETIDIAKAYYDMIEFVLGLIDST